MNIQIYSLAIGAAALFASISNAQGLLLQVDRANGTLVLTGTDTSAVNLGGYRIGSINGTLDDTNFSGLRSQVDDWMLAGTADSHGFGELLSNAFITTPVSNAISYELGAAYDPSQAIQDAGFGVDVEQNDLNFVYYDTELNTTLAGAVEYLGEKIFNNIGITVDLANGTAIIKNESPFNQVITGYLIESNFATLNTDPSSFNGVRDEIGGSGFQVPGSLDGFSLGELDATGAGIALDAGQSYSLGTIGGALDVLNFSFLLKGVGESSRDGFIKYVNLPNANGDFNNDGMVDAADYTIWRDNLGAADETAIHGNGDGGGITQSDYEVWKSNFGLVVLGDGGELAGAISTPEPNTLLLVVIAMATRLAGARGRNFRQLLLSKR